MMSGVLFVAFLFWQASPAAALPPPTSPCEGNPSFENWILATVVATDTRTDVCSAHTPERGPDGETCIEPSADHCFGASPLLVIDGVAGATFDRICGLAPGPHAVSYCGVDCGNVVVVEGSTTPVQASRVEPKLTVRVDRVIEGEAELRGQVIEGTLVQRNDISPLDIPQTLLKIQDLAPGDTVELSWPAGTPRTFTWLPGCYRARAERSTPGCTRCSGGSSSGGSFFLVGVVLFTLLRRSRG